MWCGEKKRIFKTNPLEEMPKDCPYILEHVVLRKKVRNSIWNRMKSWLRKKDHYADTNPVIKLRQEGL